MFLPADGGHWRPVTSPGEWAKIAYRDESLVTQLDGHLTADQATEPVPGVPTSSSTTPVTVVGMVEALDIEDDHTVLEIGTGTGYSTALMCHRLGEDNITTIEVDPGVAARADAALEAAGYSTWTVTGDGLLGHPRRAPYDRVIATCAVRRVPYTWVRQTKPGGIILTTLAPGSWAYGTGLAKVTVSDDGTAEGRIIGESSFMQAASNATCSMPTANPSPRSPTTAPAGPSGKAGRWHCGTTSSGRSSLGRTPNVPTSAPCGSAPPPARTRTGSATGPHCAGNTGSTDQDRTHDEGPRRGGGALRRTWDEWRWRESNPRPTVRNQGFSERSPL